MAAWREVITELADAPTLLIGGKSMGGRIASMVADDCAVDGLVCLGYPFHPPGAPDKLRTAHLLGLRTPTLVLQGTRDPFGGEDEVPTYGLSSSIRLHWLGDGDHSFKPRVRSGRTLQQNLTEALDATAAFAGERAADG
jgi:predicted alpha/beta-hydrolase family hydrolase